MGRCRWILPPALAVLLATIGPAGCGSDYRPARTPPAAVDAWPVVRVVDGDTIRVLYEGRDESVRLLCIDTPERGEPGFDAATVAMRGLVDGRAVVLEFERPGEPARDRYGRLLAFVFVDRLHVNVEMVRLGLTPFWTEYGRGRYAEDFEGAEAEARAAGRGAWCRKARPESRPGARSPRVGDVAGRVAAPGGHPSRPRENRGPGADEDHPAWAILEADTGPGGGGGGSSGASTAAGFSS